MRRSALRVSASLLPVALTGEPPLLEAIEEELAVDMIKLENWNAPGFVSKCSLLEIMRTRSKKNGNDSP